MLNTTLIPITFNEYKNIAGLIVPVMPVIGSFPGRFDNDSTENVYISYEGDTIVDNVPKIYGIMYVPTTYSGKKIAVDTDLTPDTTTDMTQVYPYDTTSFTISVAKYPKAVINIAHISTYDATLTALLTDQTIGDFVWINEVENAYSTDTTCIVIKKELIDPSGHTGTLFIDDFFKIKNDILYYYDVPCYRWATNSTVLVLTIIKKEDRRLIIANDTVLETQLKRTPDSFTSIKTLSKGSNKYNYFIYIGSY